MNLFYKEISKYIKNMQKEIEVLTNSVKDYIMDSFKHQFGEKKHKEFLQIFDSLDELSYWVEPNEDGSQFDICSLTLNLKGNYSIHFYCEGDILMFIKRDGMDRVLIRGKQTFTKTYNFESEIFKKRFGLLHLNLRDVLTYANFLGDDEYSYMIDKICDRLESLFSDKKNVERNCLFWYNKNGKENWREIHTYKNLKRIGTMVAKRKASNMFNKYKLEELNNIDMEYIVPFIVNPDNSISDICINMYGPKDNDWYVHHYDKDFINKDKTIDEKAANEDFSECFPHTNTLTGADIVRLVYQNKPISCL